MDRKASRHRRGAKVRKRIRLRGTHRLTVHRTARHIYAQIASADGAKTFVSASTVQASIKTEDSYTGNVESAKAVGTVIAERAKVAGIEVVAFDRSGFKYHGRVKALAEAAREAGLKF